MAVKIKLTKNEFKKQKDSLKRFQRYLPTLVLKKQQLLAEIRRIQDSINDLSQKKKEQEEDIKKWVDVFSEEISIEELFKVAQVKTSIGNIAGSDIPLFEEVIFEEKEYSFSAYPFWVDKGLEALKSIASINAELDVLEKQQEIIKEELRLTVQRINLFEKIKIPQAKEAIRKIRIFLGDLQTAEVVRGKISKAKLEKKKLLAQT